MIERIAIFPNLPVPIYTASLPPLSTYFPSLLSHGSILIPAEPFLFIS